MSRAPRGVLATQPASVWAITFATAVSFIGIGLVSPILPTIATELQASAFTTMLLFSSYMVVSAGTMFFAGYISSRIGIKATLLAGLVIIVVFASLAGLSDTIGQIIGLRAGWGFGNALFVTMGLAGIVGAANGGAVSAIVLYEAALGMGMALGPLVGGTLGTISWRAPFLGTAVLMTLAATTVAIFVKPLPKTQAMPLLVGFTALRRTPLLVWSAVAVVVNFTIMCLLAYAPHAVHHAASTSGVQTSSLTLGLVFFGWGSALAVASVTVPAWCHRALGLIQSIVVVITLTIGVFTVIALRAEEFWVVVIGTIVLGGLQGTLNSLLTQAALNSTDLPRNVSSSSFSAMRFLGGALFPVVSGPLLLVWAASGPFWGAVIALVGALLILAIGFRRLPDHQLRRGTPRTRTAPVPASTR